MILSKRGLNYLLAASSNPVFDIQRNQVLTETDEGYLEYLIELENGLQKELDMQEERERRLQAELAFLECENSESEQEPEKANEIVIEVPISPTSEDKKQGKASAKKDEKPKSKGKQSALSLESEDSEPSSESDDSTRKVSVRSLIVQSGARRGKDLSCGVFSVTKTSSLPAVCGRVQNVALPTSPARVRTPTS